MSHFSVAVILPKDIENHGEAIYDLMERYNENRDVAEYNRPCYCIGHVARTHGHEMADKLVGSWNERKELFWALDNIKALGEQRQQALSDRENPDMDAYHKADDLLNQAWAEYTKDFGQQWHETEHDYTVNHPEYGKADADCDSCHGTGVYLTTYNPDSKWDWYRVGGRFDGLLTGNRQHSENGFNFDAKHERLDNNCVLAQELVDHHARTGNVISTYALVTPDGEWHQQGEMGWWGMSSGDKAENVWDAELLGYYQQYAEHDVVLLDCHI